MAREKLIGYYGKFVRAALGTEKISTETLEANTYYLITGLDSSTGFPSGAALKAVFNSGATPDTLVGDDKAKSIEMTAAGDIQSWAMDMSKAEIDVTTLDDDQNVYLGGRPDTTGSLEGIYKIGTTDVPGGLANTFSDINSQAGAGGDITVSTLNDDPIIVLLYLQKDDSSGETVEFYFAPVTITSFSANASGADAQAFTSAFRIAPNDEMKLTLVKTVIT